MSEREAGGAGTYPVRWRGVLASFVLLGATLTAYGPVLGLPHLGWDTYPMLAAARVDGAADLMHPFTTELMAGRYPDAHFYRPLTSLLFMLDGLFWGTQPLGYHLTDLLILLALGLALYRLSTRLLGPGWGAPVAALVVLLHPLQIEVLPISARRSDALCTLFTVLSVSAMIGVPRSGGRFRRALLVLAPALALAAKETGAVALPLALVTGVLASSGATLGDRVHRTVRQLAPATAAVLVLFCARFFVLGGLGGHPAPSVGELLVNGPRLGLRYAAALLAPQPVSLDTGIDRLWLVGTAGLLCAVLLVLTLWGRALRVRAGAALPWPSLLMLLGAWFLGLLLLTALSGRFEPWYGTPFLAPYGLLLGLLTSMGIRRPAGTVQGTLRILSVGIATALVISHLRFSLLVCDYQEWELLSVRVEAFLVEFRERAEELEPGLGAVVRGLPIWQSPVDAVGVRGASGLAEYSVQAYADLLASRWPIDVHQSRGLRVPVSTPDRVRIDIVADEQ